MSKIRWVLAFALLVPDVARAGTDVVTTAAPPPTPTARPWLERTGTDPLGRAKRVPDRARLLRALKRKKFTELTRWLEEWQAEFERDHLREHWPAIAVRAFWIADPRLEPLLDAWLEATPKSWAPFAARGFHFRARGAAARGTEWAKQTSREQFEAMAKWHDRARVELSRALELEPDLVIAHEGLIALAEEKGREAFDRAFAAARARCAACAGPFVRRMENLRPRWIGSYPEMDALAALARPLFRKNPALRQLDAAILTDQCDLLRIDSQYELGRAACHAAMLTAPDPETFLTLARLEDEGESPAGAAAAADRLLDFDPQHPEGLWRRGVARIALGRTAEGAADVLASVRIDPSEIGARAYDNAVRTVFERARAAYADGKIREARTLTELAATLDTSHDDARAFRLKIRTLHGIGDEEVEALRKAWEAEFPSLSYARDLDDALAARGLHTEAVDVWTREIAAEPDDLRPLLERAAAYHRLGRADEERLDLGLACTLGSDRACLRMR